MIQPSSTGETFSQSDKTELLSLVLFNNPFGFGTHSYNTKLGALWCKKKQKYDEYQNVFDKTTYVYISARNRRNGICCPHYIVLSFLFGNEHFFTLFYIIFGFYFDFPLRFVVLC